jgi:shikimate dehydrogenase
MHRVGVIGWPIEHSLSPVMHNAAFRALGMTDWSYERFAIPPDIVRLSLREFRQHGFIGLNVTVPHKQTVMPFVKSDAVAKAIGAVNTIDFRTNVGTNTDCDGFMEDLAAHGVSLRGRRVVVLGAGGAARAAVYGLSRAGARVVIVNRTTETAERLLTSLQVEGSVLSARDAVREPVDLLVNCTSVGMDPARDASPWPEDVELPEGLVLYDMIYRPSTTRLMAQVRARAGHAINGMGMLVRQGAAAFRIWTGLEAPVAVMMDALRDALYQREAEVTDG